MKVSNNSLIVLLVLAMIISIGGTWISVSYIGELNQLTGFATDTTEGTTTLTVSSVTSCTAIDTTIAFGDLARTISNDSQIAEDYITIQNDGNNYVNISAHATGELWDDVAYQAASFY
ncbi:hypothetical protein K8R33_03540, partial [archaeon]|nr:hypothetical protein [archaeon]